MKDKVDVIAQEAEMEAAFEAASSDVKPAETQKTEAEKSEEKIEEKPVEKSAPEAPPAQTLSEDQIKLLSAIPKLEQLLQRVDKVDGHYGEIKRLLDETKKASATPQGAASFEASEDGDYLDNEFAEIAVGVQAKIDKALAKIPTGLGQDQLEEALAARENAKRSEMVKALDEMHPDRIDLLKSPEWKQYLEGLPVYKQTSIMKSQDLYYVSSELSKFKEHLSKQAVQAEKSKQRIEKAITPTGVRPINPSILSEDEAAQAAFDAQFN